MKKVGKHDPMWMLAELLLLLSQFTFDKAPKIDFRAGGRRRRRNVENSFNVRDNKTNCTFALVEIRVTRLSYNIHGHKSAASLPPVNRGETAEAKIDSQ